MNSVINRINMTDAINAVNNGNVSGLVNSFFSAAPATEAPATLSGLACASALKTRINDNGNDQDCYSDTGYTFSVLEPASVNDLPFICNSAACKVIIDLTRSLAPTECVADDEYYLYQDILNPIIRHCANVATTAPSTSNASHTGEAMLTANWTVAGSSPSPSTTRYYAPSPIGGGSSDSSDSHTVVWIVVLGVVGIVVCCVAGLCRQKAKREPHVQRNQYLVHGHVDTETASTTPSVYVTLEASDHRPRKSSTKPAPSPARRSETKPASSPARRSEPKPSAPTQSTASSSTSGRSSVGSVDVSKLPLLQDQQIIAVRLPYEKIVFGACINRGGYGEVFQGTYKGEAVAIKKMLPEHRQDVRLVNKFLAEIKLTSSLEHDRIVRFVGVAWNAVSDLCVVTEFMNGGDLRSLLENYEQEGRPEGVDRTKIKIALHVAHALTYMHSLQPIVLHRDLKSSNILLSQDMDAKITDFGVSRERADATMTRGVGTSLWMAPEIMMGGRYDEKADMFSFGVVLSELDSNKLPYANQVDLSSSRTNFTDIMQSVAQGRLTVDFSYESDPDIVALGRDCVSLDPRDRPTAAEALHRVHQVQRQYQQYTVV